MSNLFVSWSGEFHADGSSNTLSFNIFTAPIGLGTTLGLSPTNVWANRGIIGVPVSLIGVNTNGPGVSSSTVDSAGNVVITFSTVPAVGLYNITGNFLY